MGIFQVILLVIIFMIIFFIPHKYYMITNFFIGGVILIFLSKMDFLEFEGKLDPISISFITISYIFIYISSLFIYFFNHYKRKKYYCLFQIIAFLMVSIILIFFIDPYKYLIYKLGILFRLFLSFFPFHIIYYMKNRGVFNRNN